MHIDFSRESFDAHGARFTEAADCGSKLGEGRLRHGGGPASRYRVDYAITYMLDLRGPRGRWPASPGGRQEMSGSIEALSMNKAVDFGLS
jgi:hypothetical protein